jgi:hypothetical protein
MSKQSRNKVLLARRRRRARARRDDVINRMRGSWQELIDGIQSMHLAVLPPTFDSSVTVTIASDEEIQAALKLLVDDAQELGIYEGS